MHYYLTTFVGSGTAMDTFRPAGLEQPGATMIDLRGDCAVVDGYALLALPVRDDKPGAIYLGNNARENITTNMKTAIGSRLGLTLETTRGIDRVILELLTLHSTGPNDKSRWNILKPEHDGVYRVYLGEKLIEQPTVGGGSSFTESFNKADEGTLGPDQPWTEFYNTTWGIVSNQAVTNAVNDFAYARCDSALSMDDHECKLTFMGPFSGNNRQVGPMCRKDNTTTQTFYAFRAVWCPGCPEINHSIIKVVAGVSTALGTDATDPSAVPIKLKVSGSSLTAYINDSVSVGPITDTAIPGNKYCGIYSYQANEVLNVDNWSAADLIVIDKPVGSRSLVSFATTRRR